MSYVEFQWFSEDSSVKEALQGLLHCSGQLLKRHFSSKELSRKIKDKEVMKLPLDLVNHMRINPIFQGTRPFILEEKKDYYVIHKPSKIHCHPLIYSDQDTLLNFLIEEKKWDALKVNESNYDRGLLFRLDFETSGVMVIARNDAFFSTMRHGFRDEMKRKLYWAIVEGDFDRDGSWTHYFRATGVKGAKQKVSLDPTPGADEGNLRVKKLFHHDGKSLLLINLTTGLRHQIRAQLADLGFPILGDELYGGRKEERLYLHAWRYEWSDSVEDNSPELFDRFFDLNGAREMSHDVLRILKSR